MTIVEEIEIDNDVSIKQYKSLKEDLNSIRRNRWTQLGEANFEGPIYALWEIFNKSLSKEDAVYTDSKVEDVTDREDFMRNPTIIGMSKNSLENRVWGGIWFENLPNNQALMHIKCNRSEYRSYAHHLVKYFVDKFQDKYKQINIAWGSRNKEDDPTNFLKRNGFKINHSGYDGGFASMNL